MGEGAKSTHFENSMSSNPLPLSGARSQDLGEELTLSNNLPMACFLLNLSQIILTDVFLTERPITMDSQTFIQLTDTSLKIGLGALIAAAIAWFILWRSANLNSAPRENRRLQILEEVSAQVGTVTHIFAKYSRSEERRVGKECA